MNAKQNPGFYGWVNVAFLFVIFMLGLGLVFYSFAAIFPAMIKDMGWGRGAASVAHTICVLLMGFLTPVVALMINRFGSRKIIALGFVFMTVALGLLGTVTSQIWHWILIWGIIMPVGLALVGPLPIQTIVNFWFNIRRATALGLVMTGIAVGGFISQPFFTWVIQKTGMWQAGWLAAGGLTFLGIFLCFWVKNKPGELGQYPDGISPEEGRASVKSQDRARTYRTPVSWSLRECLKTYAIWFLGVASVSNFMVVVMITAHGALHLTDVGYTRMEAASVLSLIFLASGFGKLPMGWLGDRIEPRWILTVAMSLMVAGFIGIWKAPSFNSLMVFGSVFGFSYGVVFVMSSAIIANYYGPDAFASIFGALGPFPIVFGAMVPVGAGFIVDHFGNYDLAFVILIVFLAGGMVCSALLAPPIKEGRGDRGDGLEIITEKMQP